MHAVQPPQMLDLRDSLPRHATKRWRPRPVPIACVVTHQSLGSSRILPPGTLTRYMASYHVKQDPRGRAYGRNWAGLAYHFCIEPRGAIVWANDLGLRTYHTGGARNRDGVGIVICGDFDGGRHRGKATPTPQQRASWQRLALWLSATYKIPPARFFGHCDAPGGTRKAACPGNAIMGWVEAFRHGQIRVD